WNFSSFAVSYPIEGAKAMSSTDKAETSRSNSRSRATNLGTSAGWACLINMVAGFRHIRLSTSGQRPAMRQYDQLQCAVLAMRPEMRRHIRSLRAGDGVSQGHKRSARPETNR